MNDQLQMFAPETCESLPSVTSLPELQGGLTHSSSHNSTSCGETAALPFHGNTLTRAWHALDGYLNDLLPRHGVSVQMERDAIKGYGNSIVPQVAAEFIKAYLEIENEIHP